jgi:hypothetical protein
MLEQNLAIDGLDKNEMNYLLSVGHQWGVYSTSAVVAAQGTESNAVTQILAAPYERALLGGNTKVAVTSVTGGAGTVTVTVFYERPRNESPAAVSFLSRVSSEIDGGTLSRSCNEEPR